MKNIDNFKSDTLQKASAFIEHAKARALKKAKFTSSRKINGEVCKSTGGFVKGDKYRFQLFVGYDYWFEYNLNEYEEQEILAIFDELKEKMGSRLI